jgi:hypothetical protein
MHLIAHRGWSAGGDENSLAAFARAARDEAVTGVEFDVSRAADSGAVVVAHDPPLYTENALTLDAALSFLARTDLELFVELKEQGLASSVIEKLVSNKLADRSVVFRVCRRGAILFRGKVRGLCAWASLSCVPGICTALCASMHRMFSCSAGTRTVGRGLRFAPGGLFFSLERLARRHQVPVVVGVAQRMKDIDWLAPQHLYGAVADINLIRGDRFRAE